MSWTWILFTHGVSVQVAFIVTSILSMVVVASLVRKRRAPASTLAWILAMVLLPPIGIPLYLIFGDRKLESIRKGKGALQLTDARNAFDLPVAPVGENLLGNLNIPPATTGNLLKLHTTGEEAFADLIAGIDGAKRRIHIQTYEMRNDAVGKAILERLAARAKEGLEVRLLLDALGAFRMSRLALWRFKRAGGRFAWFLRVWPLIPARSNLRNHRKIYLFDDTVVIAGGRNLTTDYLGPTPRPARWADLSFHLTGPAVAGYAQIFAADWNFAAKDKLVVAADGPPAKSGDAVVQLVPAGPDMLQDALYEMTITALFEARKRLWIVTPYFVPDVTLVEALRLAAVRGVDVRIVVPADSMQRITDLARGPYLRDLAAAGAKVLLHKGMVHAKVVLVDDQLAMVGSANFDQRSMFLNFEVMSLIYSAPEIAAVASYVEALTAQSQPFGVKVSVTRDTLEGLARLISPVL